MNIPNLSPELQECQDAFNELDPEARIQYNQFELATLTEINDHSRWVSFLKDARVAEHLNEELEVFTNMQKKKLIARATLHDKSVGTAQMINALSNTEKSTQNKDGQMFIYSYVPLTAKDQHSPYAAMEDTDIFEQEE